MKIHCLFAIVLSSLCIVSLKGAEFGNLDFEEADPKLLDTVHGSFGTIGPIQTRLPKWSFWLGATEQSLVGHNRATVGGLITSLHDRRAFGPEFNHYPAPPFDGQFGFIFKSQISLPEHFPSLRQTGTIPSEAKMIQIRVFGDPIKVYLNNQPVPLTYQLDSTTKTKSPYLPMTIAYGNITSFAGKEVMLRIEPDTANAARTFTGIDSIQFQNEVLIFSDSTGPDEGDPIVLRRLK